MNTIINLLIFVLPVNVSLNEVSETPENVAFCDYLYFTLSESKKDLLKYKNTCGSYEPGIIKRQY